MKCLVTKTVNGRIQICKWTLDHSGDHSFSIPLGIRETDYEVNQRNTKQEREILAEEATLP